jgi:hypothetical protein
MEQQNLYLIRPNHRFLFSAGAALSALYVGALFTRHETIKIIAMTSLSLQATMFTSNVGEHIQAKIYGVKFDTSKSKKAAIRTSNRFLNALHNPFCLSMVTVFGAIGCLFALSSRLPITKMKQTVSMHHLARPWISSLALATITAETVGWSSTLLGFKNPKNIYRTSSRREDTLLALLFASMIAHTIGILGYRMGKFNGAMLPKFMKPS